MRRATNCVLKLIRLGINFYPRSPCGERPYSQHVRRPSGYFYPRSPCGERPGPRPFSDIWALFLSTLSLRRATLLMCFWLSGLLFLSTLSLRRATFQLVGGVAGRVVFLSTLSLRRATGINFIIFDLFKISIHALLAESDRHWQTGQSRTRQFLSTLSLRRATPTAMLLTFLSIHFYPRSPYGERRAYVRF